MKIKKSKVMYTLKGLSYQDVEALAAALDLAADKKVAQEYMMDTRPNTVSDILSNLYQTILKELR